MAKSILKNVDVYWANERLATLANEMTLTYGAAEQNAPDMTDDTDVVLPGSLKNASASLSGFWDASEESGLAVSYSGKSFDVSNEIINPRGLAFKSDGTAMFITDSDADSVYHYFLSSAWDISTASFDSVSFDISSEAITPQGIAFRPNGIAMFIVDIDTNNVYQYSLSSAWDISTASYDSVSFNVGSEVDVPRGLAFKSDGTAMFISDDTTDRVFQYSLSSAWDISTASYDSVSFNVGTEATDVESLAFKPDGTAMFVLNNTSDNVFQYSLSTAWDISTASFDTAGFGSIVETTTPRGLAFKSDGTAMFIVDDTTDSVFQYTLPDPYQLDYENTNPDRLLFERIGTEQQPIVMIPEADKSRCFMLESALINYTFGGQVGEVFPMELDMTATESLVRGRVLVNTTGRKLDGFSSTKDIGSNVGSNEELVAILQVYGGASQNDTLDVTVENSSGTTVITFDTVTGETETHQVKTAAGSISDSSFSADWQISMGSSDWDFIVTVAKRPV